jgi:plasmid maintenance system antidote protein VapI
MNIEKLQNIMRVYRLSSCEVARLTGFSQSHVSNILNGNKKLSQNAKVRFEKMFEQLLQETQELNEKYNK